MIRKLFRRAMTLMALGVPLMLMGCSDDKKASTDARVTDVSQAQDDASTDARQVADLPGTSSDTGVQDGDGADQAGILEAGSDGQQVTERHLCIETCSGTGPSSCQPPTTCVGGLCQFTKKTFPCTENRDCIPVASLWAGSDSCASSTDCSLIEACVEVDGKGLCVLKPTAIRPGRCTAFIGGKDITWKSIEGPDVTVCGRDNYFCTADKICEKGCNSEADCSGNTPVCDMTTHRCICSTGSCKSTDRGNRCLPSGSCGCKGDTDCTDNGADQCQGNVCGCSGVATCKDLLPNLITVCEVPGS